MQIFVNAGRTHTLEVGASQTVADVKAVIEAREGACKRHCYQSAVCSIVSFSMR